LDGKSTLQLRKRNLWSSQKEKKREIRLREKLDSNRVQMKAGAHLPTIKVLLKLQKENQLQKENLKK